MSDTQTGLYEEFVAIHVNWRGRFLGSAPTTFVVRPQNVDATVAIYEGWDAVVTVEGADDAPADPVSDDSGTDKQ